MKDIHKHICYEVCLKHGDIRLKFEESPSHEPSKRYTSLVMADLHSLCILRMNACESKQKQESIYTLTRSICGIIESIPIKDLDDRIEYLRDTYPEELI